MHLSLIDLDPAQAARRKLSRATKVVRINEAFRMHRGGVLPAMDVAYETWGELSPERDNAVLLFTGLSPGPHAASSAEDPTPGWWEYLIGPDKPIDTNRFYVICVNSLGSCFGSTGPSSIDPRTGEPYGVRFPDLSIEDIAAAGRAALWALEIPRVRAVAGASLGGMTATAYAMLYGEQVDALVAISSACRASTFAIAIRSLQRDIIRSDPAWKCGNYPPDQEPIEGMRLARKLGLTTYRSAEEWQQRFGRDRLEVMGDDWCPFDREFEVEAYLEHNARKFANTFDANSYLYLSRAMDWFDVADHGGSIDAGLSRIKAGRLLVIGVDSDCLFPVEQQQELAAALSRVGRAARMVRLPSIHGHDSFLVDKERFAPVLAEFFSAL